MNAKLVPGKRWLDGVELDAAQQAKVGQARPVHSNSMAAFAMRYPLDRDQPVRAGSRTSPSVRLPAA